MSRICKQEGATGIAGGVSVTELPVTAIGDERKLLGMILNREVLGAVQISCAAQEQGHKEQTAYDQQS